MFRRCMFLWSNTQDHSFPFRSRAKKEPQSQRIARIAPKNFLNNSRGLPVITQQNKGFEENRTRKFTRKFGKISVAQVLWGTFSVPNPWAPTVRQNSSDQGRWCHRLASARTPHKPWKPKSALQNTKNAILDPSENSPTSQSKCQMS